MPRPLTATLCLCALLFFAGPAEGRQKMSAAAARRDREVAARFAPTFRQGVGDRRRSDFITNFNFDGDWRGDNNWKNAEDPRFKLRAFVYYAVSETPTHLLIHYALFHPQDYKGGGLRGPLLSEAIREGVRRGGRYDPTGLAEEAVLAHENDMEGCLVVVEKQGDDLGAARVAYVETLSHNRFLKYAAAGGEGSKGVRVEGGRAELYVEPKGHGVEAYDGGEGQRPKEGLIIYKFAGRAEDPEAETAGAEVGYDLLPLYTTIWPRALKGEGETFGAAGDFALSVKVAGRRGRAGAAKKARLSRLGAAFRGSVGAANAARAPWGWHDSADRDLPAGSWFFDPAATVKRHFKLGDTFSTDYTHAPFLGIFR
ncbi:MAG TPA: hypothetical protein VD968_00955 [Pyrinomonadaceae bacterium]|nr:hypothetical protein [Pyrinomonadaceae bacterium]